MKKVLTALALLLVLSLSPAKAFSAPLSLEQQIDRRGQSRYVSWTNTVSNRILTATANRKLTVVTENYTTLSSNIRDALISRPDVSLVIRWKYEGLDFQFTIPAGTDVSQVFDENGYAGFLFLQSFFGENGDTPQAQAIRTIDPRAAAAAALQASNEASLAQAAAIQDQLLEEAYALYIADGKTPEEALAAAQAILPSLLVEANVMPEVMFLSQPADVVAPAGTEAVFAVECLGPGLTYQWQCYDPETDKWRNFKNGKESVFTLKLKDNMDGYIIRCRVRNSNSKTAYSANAYVKIGVPESLNSGED